MIVEIPDLTGAECGDIAITAAEGGIGHWSQIVGGYDYTRWCGGPDDVIQGCDEVPGGFIFYTIEFENPQGPGRIQWPIGPAVLRSGFERMAAAPLDKGGWPVPKLLGIAREDWTGEIDSSIADMLVQFGIFGEVVFG